VNPYQAPRSDDGAVEGRLVDASLGARFLNVLVDYVCTVVLSMLAIALFGKAGGRIWIAYAAMFAYYVGLEANGGVTPGKLLTGTCVVNQRGGKLTFGQAVVRTLVRFVPLEPISFFWGGRWHDNWSKTRVVKVPR